MASLYFMFSTMNAGKSAHALQVAHNYKERGMKVQLLKPSVDTRDKKNISSRIGISQPCTLIKPFSNIYEDIENISELACIIVDESQFLSSKQVEIFSQIVDTLNIPVMCYGLRTDFMGNLFEGSKALFELADKVQEHKTICHCGAKATMVLRINNGIPTKSGCQVQIGGNESYVSVCRKHWFQGKVK